MLEGEDYQYVRTEFLFVATVIDRATWVVRDAPMTIFVTTSAKFRLTVS